MTKRQPSTDKKIAILYRLVEASPTIGEFRVIPGPEALVTLYRGVPGVGNKSPSVVSIGTFPLDDALEYASLEKDSGV